MYRITARTIAAVALVAATALPAKMWAQEEPMGDGNKSSRITVEVENGNWLDMRVYAVKENGATDRIGTVTSFSSRRLEIPAWMTSSTTQVQLVAVPIGSTERYSAPPVIVSAGDVIEWKLTNNLSFSSIWVRGS